MSTAIELAKLRLDGGTRFRVEIHPDVIDEYAAALTANKKLPPVVVFSDGDDYWLADGFYRVEAHRQAGVEVVEADVRRGSRRDAILYAAQANDRHGVRRWPADRRLAVLALLSDPEWSTWSDTVIAKQCGVAPTTVLNLRARASSQIEKISTSRSQSGISAVPEPEDSRRPADVIPLRPATPPSQAPTVAAPNMRTAKRGDQVYDMNVAKIGKPKRERPRRVGIKAAKMLARAEVKLDPKEREALRRLAPATQQLVARRLRDGDSTTVAEALEAIVNGAPVTAWDRAYRALLELQPGDRARLCRLVLGELEASGSRTDQRGA